jgi:hypothetical protein
MREAAFRVDSRRLRLLLARLYDTVYSWKETSIFVLGVFMIFFILKLARKLSVFMFRQGTD